MKYIQTTVTLDNYNEDAASVLMQFMADIGYDSFEDIENGFNAYIQEDILNIDLLSKIEIPFQDIKIEYNHTSIEEKNWNEEWEKNYFQPITISNEVIVRSPFHKKYSEFPIDIIIEPKMSFGTGHHETTAMMIEHILELDLNTKRVLDMGCGTGILGILASMKRAKKIIAIDIDTWCVENSIDNCKLNNIENMRVVLGDADLLKSQRPFDVILANINRNILLEDIPKYVAKLEKGGSLIISGFYESDIEAINEVTSNLNLLEQSIKEKNNWVAISYIKD